MRCNIIMRDLESKGLHEAAKLISDLMLVVGNNVPPKKCWPEDRELVEECHDVIGDELIKIREKRVK